MNIGGQTFTLNMLTGTTSNNFLFPDMPVITATNATWLSNGTLLYDVRTGLLTLASNDFATNAGTITHLGISISPTTGQPSNFSDFNLQMFGSGTGSISQTYFTPGEFVIGTTYQVELEFDNLVNGNSALSGQLAGAQAVATYTTRTEFNLLVIPEPSTTAALAGTGVLAFAAVWHRRRARVGV